MSQSLGSLHVDLTAETGSFVSALSKAAYTAQSAAKQISRDFSDLGAIASQTFGAFGEFNPVISKLSFALEAAGSAASKTMKALSGMGGAVGPLLALGAGASVSLAAIGIGAAGIAAHAAESAAKLYELSRSTGLSVESLSRWSFAAKQSGIDQGLLVKSLQMLSENMVKAAYAAPGAATAFSRLGLNVRDGNGQLKDAGRFMAELVKRLSEMKDKTAAVGFSKMTMGKGGAAMLQLGDPEELQHWLDMADRLGVTLSTKTGLAAERFEQTLGEISGAATGAGDILMADLVPSLSAVANELAEGFKDPNSNIRSFISQVADLTKQMLGLGNMAILTFKVLNAGVNSVSSSFTEPLDQFKKYVAEVESSQDSAVVKAAKIANATVNLSFQEITGTGGKFTGKQYQDYFAQQWKEAQETSDAIFHPPPMAEPHPGAGAGGPGLPAGASAPSASGRPDVVAELVGKLQAQAAAELALASATDKSTAATLLAKAAGEAEEKISETRTRLTEQATALQGQLADARKEAAAGETGGGERALKIQAEISGLQKMLAELQKDAPQIKSLYAQIASGEFGAKGSKDLEDFITKTNEEAEAARKMAAAYSLGGAAVQQAMQAAKLAHFEKQRADILKVIEGLKLLAAAEASSGAMGPSTSVFRIQQLQTLYDERGSEIDTASKSLSGDEAAKVAEEIGKETTKLASEAEAYRILGEAALKSSAAQREAAAQAAAIRFTGEHPTVPSSGVYANELEKQRQEHELSIAQAAPQFDLTASFDQEIEKLQEIKAFLESFGQSTIAIDTKIYETRIAHIEDYARQAFDAQNQELLGDEKVYEMAIQLTGQWDKAANEVGTLGDKFRAMSNEIQLEGQNLGENVFGQLKKGVDDFSSTLSKFIVTGKANWGSFFSSIVEGLIKVEIQWALSKAFRAITGAPPGEQKTPGGAEAEGSQPAPSFGQSIASVFGVKLPPSATGAHAPSALSKAVQTMNVAAQTVNLTGAPAPALDGGTSSTFYPGGDGVGGAGDTGSSFSFFPGGPPAGGVDGSQSSPFYSIISDSSGNAFDAGNGVPVIPSSSFFSTISSPTSGVGAGASAVSGSPFSSFPSGSSSTGQGGAGGAGADALSLAPSALSFADSASRGSPQALSQGLSLASQVAKMFKAAPGSGISGVPDTGSITSSAGISPVGLATSGNPFGDSASTFPGNMGPDISFAPGVGDQFPTMPFSSFPSAGSGEAGSTMDDLFSGLGGSGGGSGSGGLMSLFSGAGGDAAAGAGDAAASGASDLSDLMDFLPDLFMASGGRTTKGVPYIVGEDQPEVFVPDEAGSIVPSISRFANSSAARSMSKLGATNFSHLTRREYGGDVAAGMPYLVGERRPEVFMPNSAPSASSGGAAVRGGDTVVNFSVNGVVDHDSFRRSQGQIMSDLHAAISQSHGRNR